MSIDIKVRRISIEAATKNPEAKGFILEYVVEDGYTILVTLLTDKDPTMVDTDYISIASEVFERMPGESLEICSANTYESSLEWAIAEIAEHKSCNQLAAALAAVLPPAIDR